MKVLLLPFILVSALFSVSIDESLLNIHATLLPKISLMDYDLKNKTVDNSIVIAILYEPIEYKSALSLKKLIDLKYNEGISTYKVKTKLIPYNDNLNVDANIYYLFPSNKTDIKKAITNANKNHALTFSYSQESLEQGVMLSIFVGVRVKPILNLQAIKSSDVTFRPVLLDISEIYTKENRD